MITTPDGKPLPLVVASVSGGKDSAAMCLWLAEQKINHVRVFADTGWEARETYEYLRGPLSVRLGPITEVRGPLGMADLIRKKAMFPSRLRRFCTEDLKVRPIMAHLRALQDQHGEVVNCVGIRAGESKARTKMDEWEWSDAFDCWVWRPIIAWSEQDVIDMHLRSGLSPNPLYLRGGGVSRVGCWPCIFARKHEIATLAEQDPARIQEIATLERDVTTKARERVAPESCHPRTFFHGRVTHTATPFPIEDAVLWAKADRGGDQWMLFDAEPEGCVRWGLCESHTGSE